MQRRHSKFNRKHRLTYAVTVAAVTAALAIGISPATAHASATLMILPTWTQDVGAYNNMPVVSSPTVGTLDGNGPAAIFGEMDGHIDALHLSDGSHVAGWPVYTGGAAVESTPSVYGTGSNAVVYAGSGSDSSPNSGAVMAHAANGTLKWASVLPPASNGMRGVAAGVTVASQNSLIAPSFNHQVMGLLSSNGSVRWGYENTDTVHSTAASLGGMIAVGTDQSSPNNAPDGSILGGIPRSDGGHILVLNQNGGLTCHFETNQTVDSSVSMGPFLRNGTLGILSGTGTFFPNATDTNKIIAVDSNCGFKWMTDLGGATGGTSSPGPILGNMQGGTQLDVADGVDVPGTKGTKDTGKVAVLDGATGTIVWQTNLPQPVLSSVAAADLTGQNYDDVVATTGDGAYILDGKTGDIVGNFGSGLAMWNAPLITKDPNGQTGITLYGQQGTRLMVEHFQVAGTNNTALGTYAWPEFHQNPQLTGAFPPAPPSDCTGDTERLQTDFRETITSRWHVYSANCEFQVTFQPDGNLVLTDYSSPIWTSGTASDGQYIVVQQDGNMVIYNAAGHASWASNTRITGTKGGYLIIQNDGNMVLYNNASGRAVWQSGTSGL